MDLQENPYQSPQPIDVAASFRCGRHVWPYASGHTRAVLVMSCFAVTVVLLLLVLACSAIDIYLMHQIMHADLDRFDFDPALRHIYTLKWIARWLAVALAGVFVATAIVFLMWTHRAHRNLPALGAERLKFSPGWAVGYFFIPILNLFRPYQVMCEIWRESDPARLPMRDETSGITKVSSTAVVGLWWSFSLLVHIANQAARPLCDKSTPEGVLTSLWIVMPIVVLAIAAATLAAVMVGRIDVNQSKRYAMIAGQLDRVAHSMPTGGTAGLVH
jgi:hypothetical protein